MKRLLSFSELRGSKGQEQAEFIEFSEREK